MMITTWEIRVDYADGTYGTIYVDYVNETAPDVMDAIKRGIDEIREMMADKGASIRAVRALLMEQSIVQIIDKKG